MPSDLTRIAAALQWMETRVDPPPSLGEAAAAAGLSPSHFQREFTRLVGVSPKRYLQARTAARASALLRAGRPLLAAAYEAGLSGPGRLHELVLHAEAATPATVRTGGAGLAIGWGIHETPLGDALVAITPHGVCALRFVDGTAARREALAGLREAWPAATVREDARRTAPVARRALGRVDGRTGPLALHVRGTNFQLQVWRALLAIPEGEVATYGAVARAVGAPAAVRAVGGAVGANRVAVLIPCHRVLRAGGALGGYAWGAERKRLLLARELGRSAAGA